jgi:hypothetical protein
MTTNPTPASPTEEPVSVKQFFIQAVLWLPLAFFIWYMLKTAVVAVPVKVAGFLLERGLPDVVAKVEQDLLADADGVPQPTMVITTTLPATGVAPNEFGDLPFQATTLEPLLFCYGLAVFVGLVMATPLTWRQTFAQWIGGWLLLVPIQAFGIAAAGLKQLSFDSGDALRVMVDNAGFSQELIAYAYQLGYLMLPPVVPVVIWILFNRDFVERIAGPVFTRGAEPSATGRGRSDANK